MSRNEPIILKSGPILFHFKRK